MSIGILKRCAEIIKQSKDLSRAEKAEVMGLIQKAIVNRTELE